MKAEKILGKRFDFATVCAPSFTVVSYSTAADDCHVHFFDGHYGVRQHLRLGLVLEAIQAGALVESASAPFVLGRDRLRRTA